MYIYILCNIYIIQYVFSMYTVIYLFLGQTLGFGKQPGQLDQFLLHFAMKSSGYPEAIILSWVLTETSRGNHDFYHQI